MQNKPVDVDSRYSIDDMYRYAQDADMDCRAFVSDNDMQDLFDYLNKTPDSCEGPMKTSLITGNRICYPNCEINQMYIHEDKQRWDKFKVIIFPDACEIVQQHESNGAIVGFIQIFYENILNCILPIAIVDGYPDIKPCDVFAKDPAHKSPYKLEDPVSGAVRDMMFYILAVWSVFQLAETDPFFHDLVTFTKTKKITTCKLNDQIIKEKLSIIS